MFEWINFALLGFSLLMFAFWYTLSTMPVTLSERRGERAWRECGIYRFIAILFEFASTVFIFLWIWYPIPAIDWPIHQNWWVGVIIAACITLPGCSLMLLGMFHAGRETHTPSKETSLYGGIYNYIRHPQTLGEMPIFIALGFAVNSWFMVLFLTAFVVVYTPVMLFLEERDLIKRFGDAYLEYRKRAGALWPKRRHRNYKKSTQIDDNSE